VGARLRGTPRWQDGRHGSRLPPFACVACPIPCPQPRVPVYIFAFHKNGASFLHLCKADIWQPRATDPLSSPNPGSHRLYDQGLHVRPMAVTRVTKFIKCVNGIIHSPQGHTCWCGPPANDSYQQGALLKLS
jgi:hypothetical protein